MRAILAVLAAASTLARADAVTDAADRALAAFAAKDDAALTVLAGNADPDPWLVADALVARGAHDAAEAFAKGAKGDDVGRLGDYVASRRGKACDEDVRGALARAERAHTAGDGPAALAALDFEARDDPVAAVRRALLRGRALGGMRARMADVEPDFLRAAAAAEELGWRRARAEALTLAAHAALAKADYAAARTSLEAARRIHEARDDGENLTTVLIALGEVCFRTGDFPGAEENHTKAQALAERRGDRRGAARALANLGVVQASRGDLERAVETTRRALHVMEELGDSQGVAKGIGNIGTMLQNLGEYEEALRYQERSLELRLGMGDERGAAIALGNIGVCHDALGDFPEAMRCLEESVRVLESLGDRQGVANALVNLGGVSEHRGDFAAAERWQGRALDLARTIGDKVSESRALGNLANLLYFRGETARSIRCQEQTLALMEAMGDTLGISRTLANLGSLYGELGDNERALGLLRRSLDLQETMGNLAGVAATLSSLSATYAAQGDLDKAIDHERRALSIRERIGDLSGAAESEAGIGRILRDRGEPREALERLERARKAQEEIGDRVALASTIESLGWIRLELGEPERAREHFEAALALAEEIGARRNSVGALAGLAETSEPAEAVELARQAVRETGVLLRGLGEEEGARARGQFANLFETGARSAAAAQDPAAFCFFLESGRAGALLETLGSRAALTAAVPPELRDGEAAARHKARAAREQLARAVAKGDRAEIRARRDGLREAERKLEEAIARIQRDAKRVADALYPRAADLAAIQGGLRGGEALLLYAVHAHAHVLVVTAERASIVDLGPPDAISDACEALDFDKPDAIPEPLLDPLAERLVRPLRLGSDVTRVLVSPDGPLARVPFVLLLEGREVCYVPSGTTCGVLRGDGERRGEGVLALGDPETGAAALPASGEEAARVGDVVLLRQDATEEGLAVALAGRKRWRAVHFACHGRADPEHPMLSSLALTPHGGDDGLLAAMEVFGLDVAADLVVLSACDTAKGKIYRAEGSIGFARAFMVAGVPRVLVSLWKVDDEATKALMVKFYGLWNPKDGSKGLPCATALKKAQEFVASQEPWKAPRYWAAWQLWGLPD